MIELYIFPKGADRMKSRYTRLGCFLLCLAMVLSLVPPISVTAADMVYLIENEEDFYAMMDDPYASYRLETNLDLGEMSAPLGMETDRWFYGSLDGNGHSIRYSLRDTGWNQYGLFFMLSGAEITNLTLYPDFQLTIPDEQMRYSVSPLCGWHDNGTTVTGVDVEGSITVTGGGAQAELDLYSLTACSFTADCSIAGCRADVDMDVRLTADTKLEYWGLTGAPTYYCELYGDVHLEGRIAQMYQLYKAQDSIASQNLELVPSYLDFKLDRNGSFNYLENNITIQGYPGTEYVNGWASLLDHSKGSYFTGSVEIRDCSPQFTGAFECEGVELEYDLTAINSGSYTCGLSQTTDSVLRGNHHRQGGTTSYDGMVDCRRCLYVGNITQDAEAGGYTCGAIDSGDCVFEGDITSRVTGAKTSAGSSANGLSNCQRSSFTGDIQVVSNYFAGITGSSGTDCIFLGDLTADGATNSEVRTVGDGSYYAGTVRANKVFGIGSDSSAKASIYAGQEVWLISGSNSYFSGNVSMDHDTVRLYAFGGSNNVVNANIDMTARRDAENYSSTGTYAFLSTDGGQNNSFSGSATIHARGGVSVAGDAPVTIHQSKVGTWNSRNIKDGVYIHGPGLCKYGHPHIINGSPRENIPNYSYLNCTYIQLISVGSSRANVSAGDASAGWDGSIDIEGRYEPEREPASYGIQLTDMLDQPIPDAKLILGGASYITDEGGCVYLENGPGVISPLQVQMKNADDEYETVLTRECCYPVPNRTNVIRLEPVVDLDLTFLASEDATEDSGSASGGNINVAGHQVPGLQLPLSVDVNGSLGKQINFSFKWNPSTQKMNVLISTSTKGGAKNSKFDQDTFKKLVNDLKSDDYDTWHNANQKLQRAESVGATMGFGSWKCKAMGFAEMQYTENHTWKLTDSGFGVGATGELRGVTPIGPIPGVYLTSAVSAGIDAKGHYVALMDSILNGVEYQAVAELALKGRVESAIGAGIRSARLYAEVGIGAELTGKLLYPWESTEKSLKLDAVMDAFGEVNCMMFSNKITLAKLPVKLWPQQTAANVLGRAISQGSNFTISPRNYAQGAVMQTMSADTGAASYLGLNEHNSYPYAEVRLLKLNSGKYLLVYTDDDLSRGSADRSALRACIGTVQEDGNLLWGEAVTIENDGTGDYGFAVTTDGYNVAILWQDSNTTFGDGNGVTPEDMAKSITLSQTWLDCNGNVPVPGYIATLAEAGSMPYHPVIFFDNEGLSAAWVTSSNPNPSVYLDDETETLWLSTGGEPGQMAVEGQNNISGLALLGSDLFWTSGTQENVTLYHRTADGAVTEPDSGNIRSLQSSGANLIYVKDQELYYAAGGAALRQSDMGSGYDNILRLSADGKVYAAQPGTESSRILEIVEGKALPIGEYEGYLSSWDVCDGHIVTVVRSGFTENDTAGFTSESAQQIEDTQLDSLVWDNPEAAPGSYVTFTADISNDGYNEITTLPVVITAADGRVLLEQTISCDIQPGETGEIEFAFPVPEGFSPQDVTVNLGDRTQTATLGGSNLKVDAKWSKARPDGLSVAVSNTGIGAASGTVTVSDGSKTLYSGEVTAAEGQTEDIWIPFESGYSQITDLTVTLTEASGAVHSYDNDATVTVIPQKLQALLCQNLELAPGESAELTVNPRPVNATLPHLRYRSEDTEIATVDEQGCVTAIAPGETHIIVSTAEGIDTWVRVTVPGESTPEETTSQETEPAGSEPVESQPTQPEVTEPSVPEDTRPTRPTEPEDTKPTEPEDPDPTEPEDPDPTEPTYDNPFEDVFEEDYYYDPVLWAVNEGITNGMDATHFAPEGTCTRAQIVTFLWRANGSPTAGGTNPFTDVPDDAWYTNAVLWAVENGITTGTSATTFSPDAGCTRGQVATFLWRSQGQPSVNGENIFADIAPGAYYYDAVLWAVANGITNGMGEGLFAPDATCTRGQIVTFLYRAMNG